MTVRSGRLGIGIVGAGRVGPVLGAALGGAGHAIVGITALSRESRDRADALLPGVPIVDVPRLVETSELVLLAVPGAELPGLVAGLAATGAWQAGQLVVHTSPDAGIEVLAPARASGAIPLAIHPAMSFTGTSIDLVRLRDAWCAVTAPTPVLPIAQALVVEMGAEPVVVDEADRPTYASAIASVAALPSEVLSEAAERLRGIGIDRPAAVLGPVVRSAVESALAAADRGGNSPRDV
jgi:predicted short-subunit dehydrogenase-like oxidoreductase (DUF2520 family)